MLAPAGAAKPKPNGSFAADNIPPPEVFKSELDRKTGVNRVKLDKVRPDSSEFQRRFDPKHPAADRDGYVLAPNVNPLIEMMDMREAQRSYEANMNVINASRSLLSRTVDMLR